MKQAPLVNSAELAARFGVSIGTVRGWVRRGLIPYIRASRRVVRFRYSEVEAALRNGYPNRDVSSDAAEPEGNR